MNKMSRTATPKCLIENEQKWTQDWMAKINTGKKFVWHKYKNRNVGHILVDELTPLTLGHCSYCDMQSVTRGGSKPSIDHFRPKATYRELAFQWENLFLCCGQCQEYKKGEFPIENEPLKPDSNEYTFDYWFEIEFSTGKINPNPLLRDDEKERAKETCKWLGLNNDLRPLLRKKELDKYQNSTNRRLDEWSYRFFLERGVVDFP